jgi:hypothetical protein
MSPQRPEKKKTVITIQKDFPWEAIIFSGNWGGMRGGRFGEPFREFEVFLLRGGILLLYGLRGSVVSCCLGWRKAISPSHPIVPVAAYCLPKIIIH